MLKLFGFIKAVLTEIFCKNNVFNNTEIILGFRTTYYSSNINHKQN